MNISSRIPSHAITFIRRRGLWSVALATVIALVAITAPAYGAVIGNQNGTEVGPGKNPEVTITEQAEVGDQVYIIFIAKKGWHFTKKTEVNDSEKLGWRGYGKSGHGFQVVVRDDLAIKVFHTAQFIGEMAPDANAGAGAAKVFPWDINGKFKLLYEHEGVGSDFKRTKPGTLKSEKPTAPPIDSGVATFDKVAKNRFIGTFQNCNIGGHTGNPVAHEGTATSIDLHGKGDDHQTIDCPEGDKVKVIKVYFGVDDAGKIGGLSDPNPDTIEINTFSVAAELAKAEADLAAAVIAKKKADADVVSAKKAVDKATDDVTKRTNDVNAAIAKLVNTAQRDVDARQKTVAIAQAAETAAKAAFDKVVADGAPQSSARYRLAQQVYDQAKAMRLAADKALADAMTRLATAKANAEKNPAVIAARAALEAANLAKTAAEKELTAKEAVATAASKAMDAASDLVDEYRDQQKKWAQVRAGTLIHEDGHRRILHAHIDKMTTMLNTLRVWGYAPKEARAKAIAEAKFKLVRAEHIQIIYEKIGPCRERARAMMVLPSMALLRINGRRGLTGAIHESDLQPYRISLCPFLRRGNPRRRG